MVVLTCILLDRHTAGMIDETPTGGPSDPVMQTARWTAASRARETERDDRLFTDEFAAALAGADGFAMLDHFDAQAGGNPYLPIRTRWYDDVLTGLVGVEHQQLVLLGAGLDTRAYRFMWPVDTVSFEVDRPELLADKQRILDDQQATPGCERRVVPAD